MKKPLLILASLLIGVSPAIASPTFLVDPDAPKTEPETTPYTPPAPAPRPHPHPHPRPTPPVYTPPVPAPRPVPHHDSSWYRTDLYIPGYGTTPIEFRTFRNGRKTIIAYGPRGQDKLKDVYCHSQTWRSIYNTNPYRFQHEVVKQVCRRY